MRELFDDSNFTVKHVFLNNILSCFQPTVGVKIKLSLNTIYHCEINSFLQDAATVVGLALRFGVDI